MAQDQEGATGESIWTRRSFLGYAGWVAILASLAASVLAFVRLLFPRVLFESPTSFRAGEPSSYNVGEVSERFLAEHRVWIVREPAGFYALLAVCTHLGCTPRWLPPEAKFKCPCHGSGFHRDGINFEGPAPRPLERVKISRAEDGQLMVDTAVKFRQEIGEWDEPGAYVHYTGGA